MADNFEANAGSGGDTFAADDIDGVKIPRSKIVHGIDGVNDGDVSTTNPLPVELTDNNNTVVANIAAIAAAVSGTEVQVDIVGSLPTGANAIGKLAANSGVDIGDVDVTSITNGSINGPGVPTIDSYSHIAINLTTGADQQLVAAPGASKQIWVYGYAFTCGDADGQSVSLQDEDDTAITGIMEFAQYGGISVPPSGNFAMPVFKISTNKALEVDILAGDVDGWLAYAIVSV